VGVVKIKVEHYMSYPVVTAAPRDNLARVRNLMLRYKVGHIVIAEEEKPQGIISERDFVKLLYNRKWLSKPLTDILAQDIMSKPVYATLPTRRVVYVAKKMLEKNVGSIVVVKDSASMKVAGIVTKTDLARAYAENFEGVLKAGSYCEKSVLLASPAHSVYYIMEGVIEGKPVVVVDSGKVVGIVSKKTVAFLSIPAQTVKKPLKLRGVAPRGVEASVKVYPAVMVSEIMNTNIVAVEPNEDLASVAHIIVRSNLDAVPVVDEKENLVGIVTKNTIARALVEAGSRRIT
jgi:CBS domain-containing protein